MKQKLKRILQQDLRQVVKQVLEQAFKSWKYALPRAFSWAFIGCSALSTIPFVSAEINEVVSKLPVFQGLSCWGKILRCLEVYVILSITVFFVGTFYRWLRNKIWPVKLVRLLRPTDRSEYSVFLVYGDVFSDDVAEERIVVIPVNRCFDTGLLGGVISDQSLQGKAVAILLKEMSDRFDEGRLVEDYPNEVNSYMTEKDCCYQTEHDIDWLLQTTLDREISFELEKLFISETVTDKSMGKKTRYEIGATATLKIRNKLQFVLWGLTSRDKNDDEQLSSEDYVLAVDRMLEYCTKQKVGEKKRPPMLIPIFDVKLSGHKIILQDELEFLLAAINLKRSKLNSDVYLVVDEQDRDKIALDKIMA